MKKKDMNLLDSYNRVSKIKANQGATERIYIMIVIGAIFISLAFYAKLHFDQYLIDNEISDIQFLLNSPQNKERNEEATKLSSDIRNLDNIQSKLNEALNVIHFMPIYDSSVVNLLFAERPGTLEIDSIIFDNGKVIIEVIGTRIYSASDYVMRLRRLNFFEKVEYTGYSTEEYRFKSTVTVYLKGGN